MKFSNLAMSAAAAFADSALATSPPGTLSLRFNKENRKGLARSLSDGPLDPALNNFRTIAYSVNFTLGTPPQSIATYVDTGSSDFIVIAQGAPFCEPGSLSCISGFYDPTASTTSQDMHFDLNAGFGDSTQLKGFYVSDTLGLDGASIPNVPVGVANSGKIGAASFIGFMGMGYNSSEGGARNRIVPTVLDSLVNAGQISTRTFSLWLDNLYSSTGSLLFGGVDTSKFYGNLAMVDIVKPAQGKGQEYIVNLNSMSLKTSAGSQSLNFPGGQVLLDSGASDTTLPLPLLTSLENSLNLTQDEQNQRIFIPCSFANESMSIQFQFAGPNGPTISVPIAELVRTSGNRCTFGIQQYNPKTGPMILGDTFLRSAYVLYNLDDGLIGLAQSNFNPGPSNVIPLNATSDGTILIPSNTVFSSQVSATAASTSSTSQTASQAPSQTSSAGASGNAGAATTSSTSSTTGSPSAAATSSISYPFNISSYMSFYATYSASMSYNTAVTSAAASVSTAKNAAGAVVVGKSVYLGAWFSTGLVLLGGVLGGGMFVL